jgi:hypothetical protein
MGPSIGACPTSLLGTIFFHRSTGTWPVARVFLCTFLVDDTHCEHSEHMDEEYLRMVVEKAFIMLGVHMHCGISRLNH